MPIVKRVVLLICGAVFGALTIGTAFNSFRNWNLNRLHPAPGKIVRVDGYPMHIYCIGSGAPTVVLDSGLGNDWLIWQKVQPAIARTNRVCSYDRAGIGWSAVRPGSRGALAIAEQLRMLLRTAGVHGPLLLVGHSAGGMYIRAFTGLFPAEVVGLVFVDAGSPELFHELPSPEMRKQEIARRHREAPWLYLKVATGLSRLTENYCNPNTSQRIPAVEDLARAEDCRASYMNSWLGEWDEFESSSEQVAKLPCCDSKLSVILSSDSSFSREPQQERIGKTWDAVQEQLKHLSARSTRIVARNSKHFIMVDRPDLVLAAIEMLNHQLNGLPGGIQPGRTEWR